MKTRYALLYMLTFLLSVFSVQTSKAQAVQDALYIFRNDGGFDAFFYGDIDHIEYSKIDTLGVEHPDYVVQEIYALDSLWRIPISAIDSVSFVTPETKIKTDVFCPNKSIADYIVASDSVVWIRLAKNTPSAMIPKVGDKLFIAEASKYIPNGFVGLVTAVTDGSNGITITTGELEITDIFDRLVAKAAAATPGTKSSSRTRGLFDGTEMGYTTEEPLETINEKDEIPLQGSYAIGKLGPVQISGDLSGKIGYELKEQMEIRAFLFVDVPAGVFQYDQKTRIYDQLKVEASIAGSLTGGIDFPLKGMSKKLSDFFEAKIQAGLFVSAQFTAMSFDYTREFNSEETNYLVYNDKNFKKELGGIIPNPANKSHFVLTKDTTICDFQTDGKWAFSAGVFAEIDLGIAYPFKKSADPESKTAGVQMKLRGEIGGKLEFDVPKLGLSPKNPADPMTTLSHYAKLKDSGVNAMAYGKIVLSGELGKWKGSTEPELDLLKTNLLGIVPTFKGISVTQDEEKPIRPYRIRMVSAAERDLITGRFIGFAVCDENDKLVTDSLDDFYFREKSYVENKLGVNGCVFELDPGKGKEITYHVYPMVEYMGNRLIDIDTKKEFTLDAARIDIARREISANEAAGYLSDNEIEVIPNMPNMEVKAEAKWLKEPYWLKHLNELSIGWDELPEGVKERRGVYRLIGKSVKGDTLTVDSIVVNQYRVYLDLTDVTLDFDVKGGTKNVGIIATNVKDLKVSTNSDYIKAKLDGYIITVTVTENTENDDRGGAVYIEGKTPEGKDFKQYIMVTQKGIGGNPPGISFPIKSLLYNANMKLKCTNQNAYSKLPGEEWEPEASTYGGFAYTAGDDDRTAKIFMLDENTLKLECKLDKTTPDVDEPKLIYKEDTELSLLITKYRDDDEELHLKVTNVSYKRNKRMMYENESITYHWDYTICSNTKGNFFTDAIRDYYDDYDNVYPGRLMWSGGRSYWKTDFDTMNFTEQYDLNEGKWTYEYAADPDDKDGISLSITFEPGSSWNTWLEEESISENVTM